MSETHTAPCGGLSGVSCLEGNEHARRGAGHQRHVFTHGSRPDAGAWLRPPHVLQARNLRSQGLPYPADDSMLNQQAALAEGFALHLQTAPDRIDMLVECDTPCKSQTPGASPCLNNTSFWLLPKEGTAQL